MPCKKGVKINARQLNGYLSTHFINKSAFCSIILFCAGHKKSLSFIITTAEINKPLGERLLNKFAVFYPAAKLLSQSTLGCIIFPINSAESLYSALVARRRRSVIYATNGAEKESPRRLPSRCRCVRRALCE